MDPITSYLLGQAIDVGAERTGLKDAFRERGQKMLTGLLDMFGSPAQADESVMAAPIDTGFMPVVPMGSPGPNMTDMQNMPVPGAAPEVLAPSIVADGQSGLVTQPNVPAYNRPASDQYMEDVIQRQSDMAQIGMPINQSEAEKIAKQMNDAGINSMQKAGVVLSMDEQQRRKAAETGDMPEESPGFFGKLKEALNNEESMLMISLALNSLRAKPDQGLATVLGSRLGKLQEDRLLRGQQNKTAEYLRSQGMEEEAKMIELGVPYKDVVGGTTAFKTLEARAQAAGLEKGTPEYQNFMRTGGQSFAGGLQVGSIPAGYQLVEREGGVRLEPIPGSEAERKQKLAEEQKVGQRQLEQRAGNVVMQDIGRLRDLVEQDPVLNPVLGVTGLVASVIPGSNRVNAESLAQTIRSNIGFDRLQQMREASPTGGALGQVSDRELSTLQAVLGNLSLSQSQEQLLYNLDRLKEIYSGILNKAAAYPNASEFGFSGEMPSGEAGGDPLGLGV